MHEHRMLEEGDVLRVRPEPQIPGKPARVPQTFGVGGSEGDPTSFLYHCAISRLARLAFILEMTLRMTNPTTERPKETLNVAFIP